MFDKRLLALVPEARKFVVLSVLGKWASLLAYAAFAVLLARFLGDMVLAVPEEADVWAWLGASLVAVAARFCFQAAASYAGSKAASIGKAQVRAEVYEKLVSLGPAYRESVGTAQAVQICGEGCEKLELYLGQYLPQLFYAVLAPLTLFALFLFVDPAIAVALLVCVPLIPVSIVMIMKVAKRAIGAYWDSYVDLGALFFESISALSTLKLFQADERQQQKIDSQAEGFRRATMRLLRMQLNSVTVMDLFAFGGAALGIVVALFHLQGGMLSLSGALVVLLLSIEFFMPMRVLGSYFHTAMGAAPVLDQVFSLLAETPLSGGSEELDGDEVEIVCEGLGYCYGDAQALRGATFTIEPNTFVGVVGASGSGKSTLAKILCGDLPSYEGGVRVNGKELRSLSAASLRSAVTCVSADSYIFKGTIRSNLKLANEDASDYELWRVLGRCHLDDFVLEQGGLDLPVAAGGSNLSGGQRQRLAVARALLRDTPLYIFDEATSNIDVDSEREIMACIQQLSLEKTVVAISHRLSAVAWADNILVLEQGQLVQQGTHGELAAKEGAYASLWGQQRHMEALANQAERVRAACSKADTETDSAVPAAMAEALEKMPPTIAAATRSVMKGARIRRLVQGADAMPAGHPADIPLTPGSGKGLNASNGSEQEERRSTFSVLRGLLSLCEGLGRSFAFSTAVATLGFVAAIGMVALGAVQMMGISSSGSTWSIVLVAVLVAVLGVVRGLFRYAERLSCHDQTFRVLAVIRSKVFAHMRVLAPARTKSRDAGDLISLLTNDIELLEAFYSRTVSPALTALVVSLLVAAGIASQQVVLGLLAFVAFALVGGVVPLALSTIGAESGRSLKDRSVRFGSFLYESLAGLGETLRYGAQVLRRAELGGRMGALSVEETRIAGRQAASQAFSEALILLCVVAFAGAAFFFTLEGSLSATVAAVCVAVFFVSFDPANAVAHLGFSLSQIVASGNRVLSFLEEEPETPDIVSGEAPAEFSGAALENVDFSYDADADAVLSDFSLTVRPGGFLHIAGPSGAGKSTILKLLMRVWDAQAGTVQVSGVPVAQLKTNALRTLEGSMTQTTQLFSGTIRENIAFVRPDAKEEELFCAVHKASLDDLVARLPQGLDTRLGEIGEGLSEGERQRIGLARVFLHDAPFLLLDEPTSNLDSLNEAAVLSSLLEARSGKTIVMVSHRMSAAAFADETLVVDQGRFS